jgi:thiamine kinase-like enzyme
VLKLLEWKDLAPKVYYFSNNNILKQDLTIVEYIKWNILKSISDKNIINIANIFRKLHNSFTFNTYWDLPSNNKLPYKCNIYDLFANGDDKIIENYTNLDGIQKVIKPYNRIKITLWNYFNNLNIFNSVTKFCLCHADLKKENILVNKNWVVLIDWECATSDIPETDIWRLFSGCIFTNKQQKIFLEIYYNKNINKDNLEKIYSVKKVLDFFRIFEDYISLKRKKRNPDNMLDELLKYEKDNL